MLRFLVTVVLGSALALGAAWYFELWPLAGDGPGSKGPGGKTPPRAQDLGGPLYRPAADVPEPPAPPARLGSDPVVLPEFHLVARYKVDLASPKDGKILFIGVPLYEQAPNVTGETESAPIRVGKDEKDIYYRRLDRGQIVAPNQVVARMDPALAMAELTAAVAKKAQAQADYRAAQATYEEAAQKVLRLDRVRAGGSPGAVSTEEYAAAVLMRARYMQESANKSEAIKVAEAEINKAETVLRQHEIRNDMPMAGVVKSILRSRGDTVKAQETLLQLYGMQKLRAEGLADVQYVSRVHEGSRVTLEPVVLDAPWKNLWGHRGEITGVGFVGRGPTLRIVSASEDHTLAVWDPGHKNPLRVLFHPEPVKALACSPSSSGKNWCVTGCADGSLRLWDLDSPRTDPVWTVQDADGGAHRGPVTALAFSADGRFIASGGEDNMIHLCRADAGKLVYPFDAEHGVDQPHEGPVTSLHFTPQCRLVSAGRDNTLRVWLLKEKGVVMDKRVITGRGGTVAALGVSQDGGRMIFDQGRQLQILSVADGRPVAEMKGMFGSTPFETVALFSPDSSLILTAGAPEGRMQLWHAPQAGERAYEVRRLAPPDDRASVTCAAFAPDAGTASEGSYAVSGTKDGTVYLWKVPPREQSARHRIEGLYVSQIDHALDANARQVRLGVNVENPVDAENPYGRLKPGQPVTLVIEP